MKKTVDVTITSDLICPWCYVGLRNLKAAADQMEILPKITWKPYLLRPKIPEEGTPKGGTPQSRVGYHLAARGKEAGINFTGMTDRTPNTILFHATMAFLQEDFTVSHHQVTAFQEAVFYAYFTLGIFPDKVGLIKATETLDDPALLDKIKRFYEDAPIMQTYRHQVVKEASKASRRGITSVPTFEFYGQPAFSGQDLSSIHGPLCL